MVSCLAPEPPRIGESQANPESRVAGHPERMPKEASLYGFVVCNQTNLNRPRYGFVVCNQTNLNRPRVGESQVNPMSEQLLLMYSSTIIISLLWQDSP